MSRSAVAACALFFLLAASTPGEAHEQAAIGEGPADRWVAGLEGRPTPARAVVELAWLAAPGDQYLVFEDGVPVGRTAGAVFLVAPTGGVEHTYGVAVVDHGTQRLEPLWTQEAPTNGTCELTGVGMVRTPPFVRVVVYENCFPAAVPAQMPDLFGRAEVASPTPLSDGRLAQAAGAPR